MLYHVINSMSENNKNKLMETTNDKNKASSMKHKNVLSEKSRISARYALFISVAFAVGLLIGGLYQSTSTTTAKHLIFSGESINTNPDTSANMSGFWGAWNLLESNFVETHASSTIPNTTKEVYGAIKGLTASYGDPYTVYMPPEDAKVFKQDITGSFGGVGMEIGMKKDVLTVISPLKGTPAAHAGILSGDKIVAIDSKSTDGMSADDAVKLIRGKIGTTVVLSIIRNSKLLTIKVVRSKIEIPEMKYSLNKKSNTFYIALYTFTANSPQLFDNALKKFKSSGSNKLIIDLRGNPGGYLSAAVDIASHFLPKGAVIVTEDYKGKKSTNTVHRSIGYNDISQNTKIAVLINQGSASAAEILSGALQDHKRAILIGTRSFGKGSVQEMFNIDGGSLKITIARWLTPSGKSISDGGLTPNIKVNFTQADLTAGKDPQMARAIQYLTTGK